MIWLLAVVTCSAPPDLPAPFATPSVSKFAKVIPRPADWLPKVPDGFEVTLYASKLDSPRWLYVLPNGDVLVSEARTPPKETMPEEQKRGMKAAKSAGSSANRITLLRPTESGKSVAEQFEFAKNLNQPFGMALVNDTFFIGNMDGVVKAPYSTGDTKLQSPPQPVHALPVGGYNNHWTRNIVASADGRKLYVTVGSGSNVAEHGMANELLRANILEMNPDGTGLRVFASGLRNPVGTAWEPTSGKLWTVVNERDELGDELVPDYLTSVQDGGFYGWPYSYFGRNEDPRRKGERSDLVAKAVVPDLALGSHTASLGLTFQTRTDWPAKYASGAFVGQHGSWNRSRLTGYRVAFVAFANGKPSADADDFLSGFIANENEVYGRPVGVTFAKDGALLVADDAGNCVWRVARK